VNSFLPESSIELCRDDLVVEPAGTDEKEINIIAPAAKVLELLTDLRYLRERKDPLEESARESERRQSC
jgi:hypothetical protein